MNKQKKLAKQNTPLYKRVPTLNLVDYSDIKVPLVVIYDSPKDFPGKVVARVWDGEKNRPTNVYCEYENLKRCLMWWHQTRNSSAWRTEHLL